MTREITRNYGRRLRLDAFGAHAHFATGIVKNSLPQRYCVRREEKLVWPVIPRDDSSSFVSPRVTAIPVQFFMVPRLSFYIYLCIIPSIPLFSLSFSKMSQLVHEPMIYSRENTPCEISSSNKTKRYIGQAFRGWPLKFGLPVRMVGWQFPRGSLFAVYKSFPFQISVRSASFELRDNFTRRWP